ncbi:hypothetical protein KCG34_11535 [Phenylobacterium montanum]|uniref:Cytochrome c domain-containing protein n=2 Tax=Phenylobacterium montanum TaxID=2823693 RepID=A0A975G508_9CAUL|nr:hypothetical protein KCG34_11535 [Caulobacter sp. S6]
MSRGKADGRPAVDLARLMDETPAPRLSDYHLFADAHARVPSARVTPYGLATPLFSDYAAKSRYLYLPPGAVARYQGAGLLDLPVGSVLVKTFAYPADFRRPDQDVRLIETRLLIHRQAGWTALTYVWNAEQTEAVLKRAGLREPVSFIDAAGRPRQIDYAVPNVNQCKECHSSNGAITPIGPKARNLAIETPAGGQLQTWAKAGLLTGLPSGPILATPRWDDPAQPVAARARAYLDVNCGHCHSLAGLASNSGLYLTLEEQDIHRLGVGKRPVAAGRGSGDLEVAIDPGRPDKSILAYRMASTEPGVMMPQIGRSVVHDEGLDLIRAYIAQMKPDKP